MNASIPLKLNGPSDLIPAVPYLLGFTPERSLVVIGLKDGELQCTFRVDLPGSIDHLDHLPSLEKQVTVNDCEGVVVIGYGDAELAPACVERAAFDLTMAGVQILDSLRVENGRWYSLTCQDTCCPGEGTPVPENNAITTQLALAGAVSRPDRAAVAALVAPADEAAQRAVTKAVRQLLQDQAELSWAEQRLADLNIIDTWASATGLPGPADIAALGLALGDLDIRDYAMRAMHEHHGQSSTATDLWLWVARHLDTDLAAPAFTIAGWCAYRTGDGVLALECFDRALQAAPHYRLAQMLMSALQGGIPPKAIPVPTIEPARPEQTNA
ncbi:DUF4192 domain-containing protein [Glycomyces sp. NPDC049804]|uniref:DUF4192 domain-containing protein n=1 Tax=Glycomyces sp. NPDC049804 TaxID=3154363 RepID=UPI00341B6E35